MSFGERANRDGAAGPTAGPIGSERRERIAEEPLVSVVMCARNEEKYIGAAIESILHQTYGRLELVIIDDGSSDETSEIVRSFNNSRVRLYLKQSESHGAAAARNMGVELSRGTLVALQDADDYSYPNRIELQIIAQEQAPGSRPRVVGSWIEERHGTKGRVLRLPTSHQDIVAGFDRLRDRVTFVSGTMLVPRHVWLTVPERPQFRYMEDWDQLCRMRETDAIEFCNVPEPLFVYNIRPKGVKGKSEWPLFNVFERACRSRRRAGLREWSSIEDFSSYLAELRPDSLWWRALHKLLQVKRFREMRNLAANMTP